MVYCPCPISVNYDRNSGAEAGGRDGNRSHKEMLLTDLLSIACSDCFLTDPRTTSPRVHDPQLAGTPISVLNQENAPPDLLLSQSYGGIFSINIPPPNDPGL